MECCALNVRKRLCQLRAPCPNEEEIIIFGCCYSAFEIQQDLYSCQLSNDKKLRLLGKELRH